MLAVALVAGALIGLIMGALGGGGSILTVPVLVYALHQDPQTATTASLIIVGITAITAAISHARAGHVQWRTAVVVGVIAAAASIPGTIANRAINQQLLLLVFAVLMVVVAVAMLIRSRAPTDTDTDRDAVDAGDPATRTAATAPGEPGSTGAAAEPSGDTGPAGQPTLTAHRPATGHLDPGRPPGGRIARYTKIVAAAVVLGLLTGFLGVGGGFLIVPALVLVLGLSMPQAIGTSLVVIAITSLAAFGQRLDHAADLPWPVVLPFLAAAIVGSLLGKRVSTHLSGNTLSRGFAGLLLAVAVYVAVQAVMQI